MSDKNQSLSRKAALSFISQILQQGARFIVGFFVTPMITRGLGVELYGIWSMIQQSIGYFSLSDLRPMGTLKFTLAIKQHSNDTEEKRREIGSALILWAFSFPLFCFIGGIAVWKIPFFIHIKPEYVLIVQIALAIMIFSVAIDRLLSLPANVLKGMNLEYKAMGLNAFIVLLNGAIVMVVVWAGWGLPGIAGASLLGIIISGIVRLFVVRNELVWFGFSIPDKKELWKFIKLSGWLTFSALSSLLLTASDILIVGFVCGPIAAAIYTTTGAILRMTIEPLTQLLTSANAGVAGLCGKCAWKRAMDIRSEMFIIAIPSIGIISALIFAFNKSFISLWVGQEYFNSQLLNLALIISAICKVFFRIDNIFVSGMLEIRRMSIAMFFGGICVIGFGWVLLIKWGPIGMAVATALGYSLQWVYYQHLINSRTGLSVFQYYRQLIKPVLLTVPLFYISYLFITYFNIHGWKSFSVASTCMFSFYLIYTWFLVLNKSNRKMIFNRAGALLQ